MQKAIKIDPIHQSSLSIDEQYKLLQEKNNMAVNTGRRKIDKSHWAAAKNNRYYKNTLDFGGLYLIEFSRPVDYDFTNRFGNERHYIGIAPNIAVRYAKHLNGEGAKMTKAAVDQKIKMRLILTAKMKLGIAEEKEQLLTKNGADNLCYWCSKDKQKWYNQHKEHFNFVWVLNKDRKGFYYRKIQLQ